jgi:pentatricopeptide repeat protein
MNDMKKYNINSTLTIQNALITMHARCGNLEKAIATFEDLKRSNQTMDVITWTAMINAYVEHDKGDLAINLFQEMKSSGIQPNSATYVEVLRACAQVGALRLGRQLEGVSCNSHTIPSYLYR